MVVRLADWMFESKQRVRSGRSNRRWSSKVALFERLRSILNEGLGRLGGDGVFLPQLRGSSEPIAAETNLHTDTWIYPVDIL
jgi:hypothetical protein